MAVLEQAETIRCFEHVPGKYRWVTEEDIRELDALKSNGCGSFASRSTGAIPITVRQMKTDEEDERRAETSCSASAGDGPARQGVATQSVPSVAWS